MRIFVLFALVILFSCADASFSSPENKIKPDDVSSIDTAGYLVNSWQYFLRHLPTKQGAIKDYRGEEISNQAKHAVLIDYDIGSKDLQQCADALMRLRAEYLFGQKRFSEIGFHFTSGDFYSFEEYCKGKRPVVRGNKVGFKMTELSAQTHKSLRRYLDIVYTYAGTISLHKELKTASSFDVGTIVITPESPGHCFIITDKKVNKKGEVFYKLVEGYTPARSIYVLSNPYEEEISPWYRLRNGTIQTSSYTFTNYDLKKFE